MTLHTRYVGLASIAVMQVGQFLGNSGVCDPAFTQGLTNLDYMSIFAGLMTVADWIKARLKERGSKSESKDLEELVV